MSQNIEDKANAAEVRTQETRGFMQQVRVAARRKYTPEEKVRIVLEGFRREVAVKDLCRREGIKPGAFYVFPNVKRLGIDCGKLADYLLYEGGVAVLPGTHFGKLGTGYLRLSYANSQENIRKALDRMDKAIANLVK